ncbi:MAG: N-acetylmuramoyl-L-alanine amidase [Kiritimatiellae bacterium]|jgi:N-acetylmuramoyl-L-alanine amidase|nr:N-acetylmuramoyl-L-alanine amidase [Kiritimatiellia bacterium]
MTIDLRFTGLLLLLILACTTVRGDAANQTIQWRSLKQVQRSLGITNHLWDGETICFSNSQDVLRFYPGRRKAEVNGTVIWLSAPAEGSITDGSWGLAAIDLDFLKLSVLPRPPDNAHEPLRVLLDPGHGGDDEGARCPDPLVKEKDLTLALAKRIGAQLKKEGLHVDYTRTRDVTLSLEARSRLARTKKADLFISIHANHARNHNASGVETYVLPPSGYPGTAEGSRVRGWQIGNRNDFHNTLLGFSIHRHLAATPETIDRGLKRQSFFVLRETSCPAVLLEFGFLSNTGEARRMLRTDWQEQSCAAVVEGVLAYARSVKALDRAVAEKRARDAENNERWRKHKHLAAQAARAAAEAEARTTRQLAAITPPVAAPLLTEPNTALSNTVVASAISITQQPGTNSAPLQVDTLLEFYAPDKVQ